MAEKLTIKDIAAECEVSLSTVSLVLNNNPRISEKTRTKVLAAVKKRGYLPNNQARGLASKSSHVLSVVVPNLNSVFSDVYFGHIINGIYETVASSQYKMMLEVASLKYIRSYEYLSTLRGRRADGMLFIGSSLFDKYLLDFEEESYPFILLNHYFPDSSLNYVCANYRRAGALVAQHLASLNHQQIGIISGTHIQTVSDFDKGFINKAAENGVKPNQIHWADGRFSENEGFMAAHELLNRFPKITAFACANDKMALGAMRCVLERGLNVPNDVSVIGMDNIPSGQHTTPKLTTVSVPLQEIGKQAAEAVLDLFQKKISSIQSLLPVELLERESTGLAKSR